MKLIIGSRGSRLALWQAEFVKQALNVQHPDVEFSIEVIKTTGDEMKTAPLAIIGGKGVFTKEIDEALWERRIDLAVHSLKDLPTVIPDGLALAAITVREDARDALIVRDTTSRASLESLAEGAVVGTSSPRRLAQLRFRRSDLHVAELRGNVDTRLRKLDEGDYDAVILAAAGLKRLGLEDRISALIPTATMLPAVGQGALAIETRANDEPAFRLVQSLNDPATHVCCSAERAVLRQLGGGCQLPIAAYCVLSGEELTLDALVASTNGTQIIRGQISGAKNDAAVLGTELARRLIQQGAARFLDH
jgi:hydroxymethylbilane synthase